MPTSNPSEVSSDRPISTAERWVLLLVITVSLGVRCALLGGPLDEPSWRQVWSAFPAKIMASESPPDFLHPKMNFRGHDWVSTDNFPSYEFIVAVAYKVLGGVERLPVARAINLMFYAGALLYFYFALRRLAGPRLALFSAAAFCALPVGVFYSRAVHYDMHVIFLNLGMFHHAIRFIERREKRDIILSILFSILGTTIKPPYGLYLFLPIGAYLIGEKKLSMRNVLLWSGVALASVAAGFLFDIYRSSVAAHRVYQSTTLHVNPYSTGMAVEHFFGNIALRLDTEAWRRFIKKALVFLMVPSAVGMGALGLATSLSWLRHKSGWYVASILAGGAGYVLLIFPMLQIQGHEFYLLPLLAPAAVALGLFGSAICGAVTAPRLAAVTALVWAAWLYGASALSIRDNYFHLDHQLIGAGRIVREHVPKDTLVVCLLKGRTTALTDPRMLYFSDRLGWNRFYDDFSAEQLKEYRGAGATYVAAFFTPDFLASATNAALSAVASVTYPVTGPNGEPIGELRLYDLAAREAEGLPVEGSGNP